MSNINKMLIKRQSALSVFALSHQNPAIKSVVIAALLIATSSLFIGHASATDASNYPDKAVKWVVPYSAGASNDSVARILSGKLTQLWSQPVIIDNRAGGGGTIGATAVAKAPADGYTLLMTNPGSNVNAFALRESSPYREEDFVHVAQLGWAPIVLVTRPDLPEKTVREIVERARNNPGAMTAGSSGIGGSSHLALELFKLQSKTDIHHIPYKGAANAVNDLMAGLIDMVFVTPASVASLVQAGKLKIVGVANDSRLPQDPQVPTMAEEGVENFKMKIWFGVSAPAGTPEPIVKKLNADLLKLLDDKQIRQQVESLGLQIEPSTSEEFSRTIADEIVLTRDIAKHAKIPLN